MNAGAVVAAIVLVGCSPSTPQSSPAPAVAVESPPPVVASPVPKPARAPPPEPQAPIVSPEPEPAPKPEAPAPPAVVALVEDMAIVRGLADVLVNDAQCSAWAGWASLASMADGEHTPIATGDVLHVITVDGVERRTATVSDDDVSATAKTPTRGRFALATKDVAPSPKARLEERTLGKPSKDATTIGAWVEKEVKFAVRAVGEVGGTFGDGIDRIVVFTPKQWIDPRADPEEPARRSELAVLVAGTVPKGWLPFGEVAEEGEVGWEDGAYGLQVLGVVDADGDGVREILWLSQSIGGDPLWTGLELSYFAAGAGHAVQKLGGCSYNGCDAFLPRKECRGVVKGKR